MNPQAKEATMTIDMFIGGLMVLTVAAVVVVAMTSSHSINSDIFDWFRSDKGSKSTKKSNPRN